MREHAAEPREPGYVAMGLRRMLPAALQDDEDIASSLASLVGVIYRIAGFGREE